MVHCDRGILAIVTQDDCSPIATGNVDPAGSADRRRKNEIANTFKSDRFAARLAGCRLESGENILIVPEEIERVVVKQGRGDIRRQAIEFPGYTVSARDVPFCPG